MLANGADKPLAAHQNCKLMIMTSQINHCETVQFFKDNKYFGANPSSLVFFEQAVLPAVNLEGKILMKTPGEVQLSPNGNGALFEAISSNMAVFNHIRRAELVQVIGVDNVLNRVLDPVQIGFTAQRNLDASLKCCLKRSPDEKVGVVCKKDGKYDIVEYSEISQELCEKRDPDNEERLYLELGNILMFMMSSAKLISLSKNTESLNKLYHKACKKIECWDEES
mmetsp:Transcript_11466/g.19402  ORF Transcript_11466/g.19402 Transcript_11466/m.19402 type:complete len:224 (-) Transcript_11466:432-1103(-)